MTGAIVEARAEASILPLAQDTPETLAQTLSVAANNHDIIVITGGAAEGDFDYTTAVISELGSCCLIGSICDQVKLKVLA